LKKQGKKTHDIATVREIKENLPKETDRCKIKATGKNIRLQRRSHASSATGPHQVFECPKCGKLVALVMEKERKKEEGWITSISS